MWVYIWTWTPWRLPSAYQEVEYIGTTWEQWINTWLYPWTNIQVETKIEVTSTNQDISVFWCYKWGEWLFTNSYYHLTPYNNLRNCWLYGDWNSVNTANGTYNNTPWVKYTIVFNSSDEWFYLNGSKLVSVSWTKWKDGSTLSISRRGWGGTTVWVKWWRFNYFYFKMYNKTTWAYERDFVPCYRKSDNVIWMYDIINDQFYTNAWGGTFTKWPDV